MLAVVSLVETVGKIKCAGNLVSSKLLKQFLNALNLCRVAMLHSLLIERMVVNVHPKRTGLLLQTWSFGFARPPGRSDESSVPNFDQFTAYCCSFFWSQLIRRLGDWLGVWLEEESTFQGAPVARHLGGSLVGKSSLITALNSWIMVASCAMYALGCWCFELQ